MRLLAPGPVFLRADIPSSLSQYEHQVLKPASQNQPKDDVPAFYEWATVQPGMITLVSRAPSLWRNAVLIHSRILTLLRTQIHRRARSARRSTASSTLRVSVPRSPAPLLHGMLTTSSHLHFAETAMPVIGCAACLGPRDEKDFFFGAPKFPSIPRFRPPAGDPLLTLPHCASQPGSADRRRCADPVRYPSHSAATLAALLL